MSRYDENDGEMPVLNEAMMNKIIETISMSPRHFFMGNWVDRAEPEPGPDDEMCGTAYCIGGWAIFKHSKMDKAGWVEMQQYVSTLLGLPMGDISFHAAARKILGLTNKEAGTLFYEDEWPDFFYTAKMETDEDRIRRAVGMLQFVIDERRAGREADFTLLMSDTQLEALEQDEAEREAREEYEREEAGDRWEI